MAEFEGNLDIGACGTPRSGEILPDNSRNLGTETDRNINNLIDESAVHNGASVDSGKTKVNVKRKPKAVKSKGKRLLKALVILMVTLIVMASTYLWLCYTNNGFVSKWRTLYIETAMSTMTHQWLATSLLPKDVVQPVVDSSKQQFEENIIDESLIAIPDVPNSFEVLLNSYESIKEYTPEELNKQAFEKNYYEIDITTMPEDTDYSSIQISDIVDLGIKTTAGDAVWCIDTVNNLMIVELRRSGYVGKLAIIKDSSLVELKSSTKKGRGQTVNEMCLENNGILGINASGFADQGGHGNGGVPVGLIITSGQKRSNTYTSNYYQIAGFDQYNNFRVGRNIDTSTLRDAMQFYPIAVLNGEKTAKGSYGLGIQPRTMIGQTHDKSTLMLVVDGRQIGYSVGASISDCAGVMLEYGAYNAMNMDGGSSSSMTYNGKMITKTSSPSKGGRYIPACWVVKSSVEGLYDTDKES